MLRLESCGIVDGDLHRRNPPMSFMCLHCLAFLRHLVLCEFSFAPNAFTHWKCLSPLAGCLIGAKLGEWTFQFLVVACICYAVCVRLKNPGKFPFSSYLFRVWLYGLIFAKGRAIVWFRFDCITWQFIELVSTFVFFGLVRSLNWVSSWWVCQILDLEYALQELVWCTKHGW